METRRISKLSLVLFVLMLILAGGLWCPVKGNSQPPTYYTGKLSDNVTDYQLVVPQNWNGTLLASLDILTPGDWTDPNGNFWNWLVDNGYAFAGTTARDTVGWDLTKTATAVYETLAKFEQHVGKKPTRNIVWGMSQGGITTRAVLQLFPEHFDGGLPMCGGGEGTVGMWNTKLDATFALDVLLGAEYGIKLQLNNISNVGQEMNDINQILQQAQSTREGRARVALAGAFAQTSTWNTPGQIEPAKDDYELKQANQAVGIPYGLGTVLIPVLEKLGGGPFTWNHGINYRVQLARSGYEKLVEEMYKKAGLDLEADLDKLAKTPRLFADPDAVSIIEKYGMTWTGELRQPVLSMLTTGDMAGPISDEHSYAEVVRYAGNNALLRQSFVHRPGHCNFTTGEQIAALVSLIRRLDTGRWENDASARGLTQLVQKLQAQTTFDLGGSNFVQIEPPNPQRTWDVRNWDSYNVNMK